jgi:hypothetical protein
VSFLGSRNGLLTLRHASQATQGTSLGGTSLVMDPDSTRQWPEIQSHEGSGERMASISSLITSTSDKLRSLDEGRKTKDVGDPGLRVVLDLIRHNKRACRRRQLDVARFKISPSSKGTPTRQSRDAGQWLPWCWTKRLVWLNLETDYRLILVGFNER